MNSNKRKIKEDICRGFHLQVMKRRMWQLQIKARTSPRRVPRVGTSRRVKGRRS
jgi:hypothetical protein